VLPGRVQQFLQGGYPVVLATVDAVGAPMTTLVTWIIALDATTLRVVTGGAALENLRARPHVSLELIGDGFVVGMRGTARVIREAMGAVPFPSAGVEIEVAEVRDHSHHGVVTSAPTVLYAHQKTHRYVVEDEIFAELRGD
jgi:hypothetical protein